MIKIQGTVFEIFANKMVTTNLGHPVYHQSKTYHESFHIIDQKDMSKFHIKVNF